MIALALLVRLQCALWSGTDFDCQAQWNEDACNPIEAQAVQWCAVHYIDQSAAGQDDCVEARLPDSCK